MVMFRKFSKIFAIYKNFKTILFIDDSPFTHQDANYFLNKFEEMNNRQIKIEREISDIRKLLASSGIESDLTIENEFINVSVYICYKASFIETFVINSKYFEILRNTSKQKFVRKVANSAIDKRIYPDESYLKSVAAGCAELEFYEYFGSWENNRWSSYYTKYIKSPVSFI